MVDYNCRDTVASNKILFAETPRIIALMTTVSPRPLTVFPDEVTVIQGLLLNIPASCASLLSNQSYMVRVTNTVVYILHLCPCSVSHTHKSSLFFLIVRNRK